MQEPSSPGKIWAGSRSGCRSWRHCTTHNGIDYLAGAFSVFKYGLIFRMGVTSWIFLHPWVAYVTIPFYRRLEILRAYEYLEHRFNSGARMLAAAIFLLWRLGRRCSCRRSW